MKKPQPTGEAAPALTPALRRYLYFTAAVTGGAIMIVEILGAKMLAPYMGTSHFVWTSQIAVTLAALAAGYYAGGRLADRVQSPARLYACITAAALYLAASSLLVRPVANACLVLNLALGSLLASTGLFFLPLALLAMTGPYLARVITATLAQVGGTVGRLTALGTVGSLAGTLLIGYVLLPLLPNSYLMFLTAGLLLGVGAGYFFIWSRKVKSAAVLGVLVAAAYLVSQVAQQERPGPRGRAREIYRGNSAFGLIQVIDLPERNIRLFLNDFLPQNSYDPREKKSVSEFTYLLHGLARAYARRLETALCIGLGVGIVPMQLAGEGVRVDAVEINPAVVPVAERYFGCQPERFRLVLGDGRCFINRTDRRYDAILLDAFTGESVPSHLMTAEALGDMRRCLTPQGVLVINCGGSLQSGQDFFSASLEKTLRSVFRSVRLHAAAEGFGNMFFVASDNPDLAIIQPMDFRTVHPLVRETVAQAFNRTRTTKPAAGRVLTDNYNPVEYYDAANRMRFRRQVADMVRKL